VARSLYVTSPEGETGKGMVALGALDLLTRRVGRIGVFRPIVRSDDRPDYVLELLLDHQGVDMPYESAAGVSYDRVHSDPDAAMSTIVDQYHEAAAPYRRRQRLHGGRQPDRVLVQRPGRRQPGRTRSARGARPRPVSE